MSKTCTQEDCLLDSPFLLYFLRQNNVDDWNGMLMTSNDQGVKWLRHSQRHSVESTIQVNFILRFQCVARESLFFFSHDTIHVTVKVSQSGENALFTITWDWKLTLTAVVES